MPVSIFRENDETVIEWTCSGDYGLLPAPRVRSTDGLIATYSRWIAAGWGYVPGRVLCPECKT